MRAREREREGIYLACSSRPKWLASTWPQSRDRLICKFNRSLQARVYNKRAWRACATAYSGKYDVYTRLCMCSEDALNWMQRVYGKMELFRGAVYGHRVCGRVPVSWESERWRLIITKIAERERQIWLGFRRIDYFNCALCRKIAGVISLFTG